MRKKQSKKKKKKKAGERPGVQIPVPPKPTVHRVESRGDSL
jgi:hypothetical protein